MNWHADRDTLVGYTNGRIAEVEAFSLEAHLLACAECRGTLAGIVGRGRHDRVWTEIADQVDRPRGKLLDAVLARMGMPGYVARLLIAAPVVRPSWVLTVAAVLGFTIVAGRGAGSGFLLFLIVAPVAPVAGILFASGRATDPLDDIGLASPTGGFRLLLIRTAANLLSCMALAAVAVLAFPETGWIAGAWLLPSLTLTVLTLALSTKVSPHVAVTAVTLTWVAAIVLAERLTTQPYAAFGLDTQLILTAVGAASVALLIVRRGALETRSPA
jgi:hypothetical protein